MEKLNFDEFGALSSEQWKDLATKELKGNSPDELVWQIEEGISCPPYLDSAPDDTGLFYRSQYHGSYQWKVHGVFTAAEVESNPANLLDALNFGCNSISIRNCNNAQALVDSLKDVNLSAINLYLETDESNCQALVQQLQRIGDRARSIRVCQGFDEALPSLKSNEFSAHRLIVAPGIQNRGGSAGLELALAISKGHEALLGLMSARNIDDAAPSINFELGIGPLYIPEIAKFRAFRRLWNRIVSEYNPEHSCTNYATVHAAASSWFLSSIDTHTNLLRLTTMAASAAIGGADSIYLPGYNSLTVESDHSARRTSLNIHNVLRMEGKLDWVADPARGSHTIELLTQSLAEKAWLIFQDIESKGGYAAAAEAGYINEIADKDIRISREKWKAEAMMIGVSDFRSPFDGDEQQFPGERLENLLVK